MHRLCAVIGIKGPRDQPGQRSGAFGDEESVLCHPDHVAERIVEGQRLQEVERLLALMEAGPLTAEPVEALLDRFDAWISERGAAKEEL